MSLPAGLREDDGQLVWANDGAPMVAIPAGAFLMGVEPIDIFFEADCKPRLRVSLDAYYIDRDPVTVERFRQFMADGGYHRPELWSTRGWRWRSEGGIEEPATWDDARYRQPELPVSGVSWYEASAYVAWAGKALPSEAQWERAARGDDGRLFPWGPMHPNRRTCNYAMHHEGPTPAGQFPEGRSPSGCNDMAGNVNNWCYDLYHPGAYDWFASDQPRHEPRVDPVRLAELGGPAAAEGDRVDRGGGFATAALRWEVLACAGRTHWPPDHRAPWHGFRCVVNAGG